MTQYPSQDDPSTVLRARARELARKDGVETPKHDVIDLVGFTLGAEGYAVEACHVAEAWKMRDVTPIPFAPAFVAGCTNHRGRVLPVVDLRPLVGMPSGGLGDANRVLVVRDGDREAGLLADEMTGIATIARDELVVWMPAQWGPAARYLLGVTRDRVAVLDVPAILGDERLWKAPKGG